jgi:MFS family permease
MSSPPSIGKEAHVQGIPVSTTPPTPETPFDRNHERRLLQKLDIRILPVLWLLYLVNFIDRYTPNPPLPSATLTDPPPSANIGNAKIQGMEKELHLINQRFNISVWVFNLGYLVAGIPMQLVFKKYGPRSLCVMMFAWGITVVGCGLVKRWEQLVVCRLLEGMAESAYISGAAYLIGSYYTKTEYLTRFVFFSTAGIVAGAINGFVSSLIAKMDGTAGYGAWRWCVLAFL